MKIRNVGLFVLPQFIRSLIQNRPYGYSVLNITCCVYSFCPEVLCHVSFWIMVRAISCNVLFFLSTTPFCCEVLGQEKSWDMPFESKRFSRSLFSNSPP